MIVYTPFQSYTFIEKKHDKDTLRDTLTNRKPVVSKDEEKNHSQFWPQFFSFLNRNIDKIGVSRPDA